MTDEQLIEAYYPQAVRMWRPEYGDMVRVPVRRSFKHEYNVNPVDPSLVADVIEYKVERGFVGDQALIRVVGRYKGAEVEVDSSPRSRG